VLSGGSQIRVAGACSPTRCSGAHGQRAELPLRLHAREVRAEAEVHAAARTPSGT